MRRIPVILALTALVATGLVGCAAAVPQASCANPMATTPASTSDLIEVTGAADAAPDVEVRTPFHVTTTTSYTLDVGDGPQITTDTQLVAFDISLVSGETGQSLISVRDGGNTKRALPLAGWATTFPELADVLACATEGSRIVVAFSPGGITPEAAAPLGLAEGESAIAVVDLRKVYLAKADGADQFNDARGLPTVVRAPDGRPGIIVPGGAAPTDPVTQVLKKGDGAEVNDRDSVLLALTSVEWTRPTTSVSTTWDGAPLRKTLDALPPVIADALNGEAVGSQILVVQPASEASDTQRAVPATVYVIDILGVG